MASSQNIELYTGGLIAGGLSIEFVEWRPDSNLIFFMLPSTRPNIEVACYIRQKYISLTLLIKKIFKVSLSIPYVYLWIGQNQTSWFVNRDWDLWALVINESKGLWQGATTAFI